MEAIETPGYCTLCRSRCGTLNTVRNGQLVSVRADASHPTGSAMCMKGRAAPELVHSPHRLRYPMRRTQAKGAADPGWERLSWDEALSQIAAKLSEIRQENGAEAVVFGVTTPSGTPLSDSIDWIERFVRHFGSPNICYATEICNWHKDFAHAFTFGVGMPTADVANADLIMLWGHNPANAWLAQATAVGQGRARGARLVVIDPRPTALAQQADCWLRIKPGYDTVLALGLIHLLIAAGNFDETFVKRWSNGSLLVRSDNGYFLRERDLDPQAQENRYMTWNATLRQACPLDVDPVTDGAQQGVLRCSEDVQTAVGSVRCTTAFELLVREVAAYVPEHVSALTGIPVAQLQLAAKLIGASERIAYHAWSGVGQHTNATQTERAIAVLYALTGCFDKAGGNRLYPTLPINPISQPAQLDPQQRAKALGIAQRPLGPPSQGWVTARDTWQAILEGVPYRVRAMFNFGANPLSSQADIALAKSALENLEFHVQCDLFDTPTAQYADILLPVNTPWEREGLRVGFELNAASQGRVQLRQQLVASQGEARSDNQILFDLACRMGMADAFFGGSLEAGWNHMLAPLNLSVDQLRATPQGIDLPLPARERLYETSGFKTQTRRVELYSELLLRHGQPALPTFVAPAENTRGESAFPIQLSSAKNGYFCHSQHRSLVSLRKRAFEPTIQISGALAAQRQIVEGDPVIVRTRHGQARFEARVSEAMQADVAVAEFGWWQACPEIGAPGFSLDGADNRHFNGLISSAEHDPVSGSVAHRSYRCEIVRDPLFDTSRRRWVAWRPFTVTDIASIAQGVVRIALTPEDGGGLPDFLPGQHLTIRVPLSSETADDASAGATELETLTRAYSLTSAARDSQRRNYTIAVRHQQGWDTDGVAWEGALSTHLHKRVIAGQKVFLRAPSGRFTLPIESSQPIVLVAGGIGITPFICLLETLVADMKNAGVVPLDITLHYANRGTVTHAFKSRLQQLCAILPCLRVVDYYPPQRITDQVVSEAQIAARARIYMCGPLTMMRDIRTGLVQRGMPDFDIFHEAFAAPPRPKVDSGQTHSIVFARSRRALVWGPDSGTVLELAEHAGIPLPNGCRVGQCESCAVRVLQGSAQHLHGETPEDPDMILSCQAIPLTDMELDA